MTWTTRSTSVSPRRGARCIDAGRSVVVRDRAGPGGADLRRAGRRRIFRIRPSAGPVHHARLRRPRPGRGDGRGEDRRVRHLDRQRALQGGRGQVRQGVHPRGERQPGQHRHPGRLLQGEEADEGVRRAAHAARPRQPRLEQGHVPGAPPRSTSTRSSPRRRRSRSRSSRRPRRTRSRSVSRTSGSIAATASPRPRSRSRVSSTRTRTSSIPASTRNSCSRSWSSASSRSPPRSTS